MRTLLYAPITILTRTGQFLAAASLTVALAFTAAPIARADWDIEAYDACLARKGKTPPEEDYSGECCDESGGRWSLVLQHCTAPAALELPPPPPPRSVIVTPVAPVPNAPILPVSPGGQAPTAPAG